MLEQHLWGRIGPGAGRCDRNDFDLEAVGAGQARRDLRQEVAVRIIGPVVEARVPASASEDSADRIKCVLCRPRTEIGVENGADGPGLGGHLAGSRNLVHRLDRVLELARVRASGLCEVGATPAVSSDDAGRGLDDVARPEPTGQILRDTADEQRLLPILARRTK